MRKTVKCYWKEKACRKWANGQNISDSGNKIDLGVHLPLLLIHVYDQNVLNMFIGIHKISGEHLQDPGFAQA